MTPELQTWAAVAVVILTAGVFAFRCCRKKKSGCGHGCGCTAPQRPKQEP